MASVDEIRQRIGAVGYGSRDERILTDEHVRAYVGERLAGVASENLEALDAPGRECYDRTLLRCEFLNPHAAAQTGEPQPAKIEAVKAADSKLLEAAQLLDADDLNAALRALEQAFDARDAAMTNPA